MSSATTVPTLSWAQIYPGAAASEPSARLGAFLETFQKLYPSAAADDDSQFFVVRSPGRVNIIGEHLDYSHFSVFPMAVERDMIMAVRARPASGSGPGAIRLANTDAETFPAAVIDLTASAGAEVEIDAARSDWANYFRCGLTVAQRYLRGAYNTELDAADAASPAVVAAFAKLAQMDVLVDGNIPTGSGLSSSAAFVVCSTLATILANHPGASVSKNLMVQLSMKCEQLVGVNTGGMDQAASVYGQLDHALYVSFAPRLAAVPKSFPSPPADLHGSGEQAYDPEDYKMTFVIAHTLVTANKHETAPTNYNLRVVEVTLAALALAKSLGLAAPNSIAATASTADNSLVNLVLPPTGNLAAGTLRDVFELFKAQKKQQGSTASDDELLAELIKIVDTTLRDDYTFADLPALIASPEADPVAAEAQIARLFFTRYPVSYEALKLRARARHVYTETARVHAFIAALDSYDRATASLASYLAVVAVLGALMDDSETSMFRDFESSCAQAQQLCAVARGATDGATGTRPLAYGSRTTGAGWGGATVHLVLQKDVPRLAQVLKEKYYKANYPQATDAEIEDAIIISRPANGTAIVKI